MKAILIILLCICLMACRQSNISHESTLVDQDTQVVESKVAHNLQTFLKEELEEDYDMFIETLLTHNTFTFADKEAFEASAMTYRHQLNDGMNEVEFYRILSQLISDINCSHTRISLDRTSESIFKRENLFLPLDVYYMMGNMYVVSKVDEIKVPIGAQLISINGYHIHEIVDEISNKLWSDNMNITYKVQRINDEFFYLYNLLFDNNSSFEIEYVFEDETYYELVEGYTYYDAYGIQNKLNLGESLSYNLIDDVMYLRVPNFNTIGRYQIEDYENFYADFFTLLQDLDVTDLIIDVRANNGGHPEVSNLLLSYLAREPFRYFGENLPPAYPKLQEMTLIQDKRFQGQVFVLCDGGSLSTTGHFLGLIKFNEMAEIVGENSGAGSVCTDSSFDTLLNHTKMTLRSSSVKWFVDVSDLNDQAGIVPDYNYISSLDEVINQEDGVLNYTLSLFVK